MNIVIVSKGKEKENTYDCTTLNTGFINISFMYFMSDVYIYLFRLFQKQKGEKKTWDLISEHDE